MVSEQLITTLTLHGLSGLVLLLVGIFVLLQQPKRLLNQALFANLLAASIFEFSFVIAPLMPTHELAYAMWMLNSVDIFIGITTVAFTLLIIGEHIKFRWYLIATTVVGLALFASILIFPQAFIPEVTPKLYFPWYLNAGPLYVLMLAFFLLAPVFPYVRMVRSYLLGFDKTRSEYFILMYGIAYCVGSINFFLVFDIPIDPLFGSAIGFALVPVAYGMLAKQLLDAHTFVVRAALFSSSVAALSGVIVLLITLNGVLLDSFPWLGFWTTPIFTAFVIVLVGRYLWLQSLKNEKIKYEFITVATHKIRTPLTQISWATRTLLDQEQPPKSREIIEQIQQSNNRLIELTNVLFKTAEEVAQEHAYSDEPLGLISLTHKVLPRLQSFIDAKKLKINIHSDTEVVIVADERRLSMVIEVLVGNAVMYSNPGGLVQIMTYQKGKRAFYAVRDQGIGISPADRKNIFTRFYRSDAAKRMDTEGVGVGLTVAKNIIEHYKGSLSAESPGEGKGSVFWFSIPLS